MMDDGMRREETAALHGREGLYEPYNQVNALLARTNTLERLNAALRQRESSLREQNHRLQAALSASSTGTFSWHIPKNQLRWDKTVDRLFGRKTRSTAAERLQFFEAVHPDDRTGLLNTVERCAKEAGAFETEFRIVWPDGSVRWLHAKGRTVCDQMEIPVQMTGAVADVTEHKRRDERLRESEQRFRLLSEAIPAIVWTCTPDGREEYFNQSWCRYTGLSEACSVEMGWATVMHPDDRDHCLAPWRDAVGKAAPYLTECRYRRHDGEYRWHVVRVLPLKRLDGTVLRWVGVSFDIDEHRRMEEALRQNTEALILAQQGAHAGTWDWDILSGQLHYSPEYKALYGWDSSDDEASYEHWLACVHPDDQCRADREVREAAETQSYLNSEFRIVRPDGAVRWLWGKGKALADVHGRPTRMVGITFDITVRKQAEADILRLLDEAEQREQELREKQAQLVQSAKLASIGELATGVAHEINNPLNNISLCAGNLIDALQGDTLSREAFLSELQLIMTQVQKAALIVDHLRGFGRVATRQHTAIRVNDVVRSSLSLMREQLRLRDIEIVMQLAPDDPLVEANALQLEQVILNLMTNARDAVSVTATKIITIATALEETWVSIRVADTGIGMSDDVKARIFDPFFTTKDVGKGTGLGLSLSYGIIKDHQGGIAVESRPGQGSTFMIYLPHLTSPCMPDMATTEHQNRACAIESCKS